jgi:hypothetical protein
LCPGRSLDADALRRYCVFEGLLELDEPLLPGVVGAAEGEVVEEDPALPAGGVAVELRGAVLLPELPDVPLDPPLSQPTSAKVAKTAPARSIRLSIEALLPQYSR